MIPTLSKYIQQLHYERVHWLTRRERKRAAMLVCAITICVIAIVYLWMR